jgi:hypothetical protein
VRGGSNGTRCVVHLGALGPLHQHGMSSPRMRVGAERRAKDVSRTTRAWEVARDGSSGVPSVGSDAGVVAMKRRRLMHGSMRRGLA